MRFFSQCQARVDEFGLNLHFIGYFQDLLIQHTFDVMHYEKNFVVNILKTILGEKNNKKVKGDFEKLGICGQPLWLKPHPTRIGESIMPLTPWVMPKEDRSPCLDTMANLKLPTRFASGFKKHIVKSKFGGMKSHNYHVLLQQIHCM